MLFFKKKVILTDIDGVMLDWEEGFSVWMEHHGYKPVDGFKLMYSIGDRYGITKDEGHKLVRLFNESAAIGFLPSLRDATYFVKRLHEEHGFKFHCITSLSKDTNAQRLREINVRKTFGRTAFEKFIFLDTGADKDEVLKEYEGSDLFWIEDKPENADVGHKLGLRSLLVEHGHNMTHTCNYPIVKNWKQIYTIITGELK